MITYRLAYRRVVMVALLSLASVWALIAFDQFNTTLPHLVYLTGWGLLGLMLYLTLYNSRKKLPFLPLVSSRAWLQLHIYLGLFTGLVFLMHMRWHWPQGWFEMLLAPHVTRLVPHV